MKTIHYTEGYGGELNYLTICEKEIRSHGETEGATIHPIKVTCEECLKTEKWKEDIGHATGDTKTDIKRRIYIESDILHASELRRAQRTVNRLCKNIGVECVSRVFSEVLDYAWHNLPKTWESVKKADEIYAESSLIPLTGNSYTGAPVIFNKMCELAIKEKVTGKSIFILNNLNNIEWDMIEVDIMKKVFTKKNSLFMYDEEHNIVKVDVDKIKT